MSRPVLDYANVLAPRLEGRGLEPGDLDGRLAERFRRAHEVFGRRHESGELGFLRLPRDEVMVARTREMATKLVRRFSDLVVLGIGGSALGAVTLRDALLGLHWNERTESQRNGFPRLYVLDNPDPDSVSARLDSLDLNSTLFDVVSKSGSTAETMAQYLIVREKLESALGLEAARERLLFTTDPDQGVLRHIARHEGIRTLPVPPDVGGRFSVLSPVGLFPITACGVDPVPIMAAAEEMRQRCSGPVLTDNPAGLTAVLLHAAHTEWGAGIHVLMPYADRLRSLAAWFQQLWAESLGKKMLGDGDGARHHEVGPTPLAALGATDQHAQVQLFMEGPRDKVVIFVGVGPSGTALEIPRMHTDQAALAYLGGHTLAELMGAERRATTEALRLSGRPSMTIELSAIDAGNLGAVLMLFQMATIYAAALYGVDPLDQPGVELGKRLVYGMFGREGFDAPELPTPDPRWRI